MFKKVRLFGQFVVMLSLALIFSSTQAQKPKVEGEKMENKEVTIRWFGHSCFMLSDSVKIVTDPFDKSVGYPVPNVSADIVLVSHEHFDHNNVSAISGKPEVIRGGQTKTAKGITFKAVKASHGDGRGDDYIRVWEFEGIRFAHFGDLGVDLTDSQYKEIGPVDVVFIPVGGYFTIDAEQAIKIINKMNPKVVFPMHYKTPVMGSGFPISTLEPFLKGKKNVVKVGKNSVRFSKDSLPKEMTVYVLEYK
ncbi:MAG: MBL fold metallo-hydrolase [candidate division Zixibacteria bacterium]|nr:MBL fold metallo-hydrolase [candidate division Zixibacteria bacterium]